MNEEKMFYNIPIIYNEKDTVYIIAGGASIKRVDLSILTGKKVIGVNHSYKLPVKLDRDISASKNILAQVQRELNLKGGGNRHLKPVELSSVDEAVKQEATLA